MTELLLGYVTRLNVIKELCDVISHVVRGTMLPSNRKTLDNVIFISCENTREVKVLED